MKSLAIFVIALHYILAINASINITITKNDSDEKRVIHKGQHDIVKIYPSLPLKEELQKIFVFFLEADINNDGSKIAQGLYVIVENSTTKLHDNGKDIDGDAEGNVFFACKEGIYTYNHKENKAYKYGNLNESIISLAVENSSGIIYALTENHDLYKIFDNGSKSDVDNRVKNAQEIVLDTLDNLYYYDNEKNVYQVKDQRVNKIEGLPKNPSKMVMIKIPLLIDIKGIVVLADDVPYVVYSNGTSIIAPENFGLTKSKPTAFSADLVLVIYFAIEKKLYQYDMALNMFSDVLSAVGDYYKFSLN
ncbi:uncharacterized protein LOC114366692 [Ostrinia furnacalis]|uniref:uncharacterized protein LOC114366692 n=1 Tax=Ostrinia furnacalis TaxID=93504 RepID=UPI00103881FD|nr:uncharacterized protein LOC114366692 [Ostrinia furnacalis]